MTNIDEKTIFEMPAEEVSVHADLPRQRKDLGEIQKMMDSIQNFGQLQPIVINRNKELIAGGRRLAACLMLGVKARVCYKDTIDPVLMRELELEENLQRKDLTPAEECFAVDELVALKQKKYGKPVQGKEGGFTLENAASAIGKTKGNVIESLQIADMIRSFPNLSEAKTKSEIKKAYKGLQRIDTNIAALAKFEKATDKEDSFKLVNMDALEHMPTVPDATIDLLFTDPPYGIDIDKIGMTTGGKTGGDLTTTGIKYDDSKENALNLYQSLAIESYRFCTETAHVLLFLAPSHFQTVKEAFTQAGWLCSERPLIWVKQASGQNNQPDYWFSSAYEMLLFARKPLSRLVMLGKPDWIQCNIVTSEQRTHQAEKPIPLCKELITRVSLPGQTHYDPFAGSGALVEAACKMHLISTGCEISLESYATAMTRLNKWKEKKR